VKKQTAKQHLQTTLTTLYIMYIFAIPFLFFSLDFGEITLWIGVFITASASFTNPTQYISILSPLFVASLLIFLSGIPPLEKLADEKYKDNAAYKKYKETVPVLIPFIGRKGSAKF
jgi:steroid 5-alpha reductase family enzyme